MLSEIHTVTIGVADLNRSKSFYEQTLGFKVWNAGDLDVEALASSWGMPRGLTGRYAVLAPEGAEAGFLRLIEWSSPGERIWGNYDNYPDLGLFAINFRVSDLQAVWARLIEAGAAVKAPVTRYKLGGMDVIDGQCFDPDGVIIDVHQVSGDLTGIEEEQVQYCTPVASVSIHAGPVDAAKAFYTQLGFEVLYDKELTELGPFLGFPEGLVLRNANLVKPGRSPHGRVELSDYVGKRAASRTSLAVPPNLGIMMLSFKSDDFERDVTLLEGLGARPGPVTVAQFGSSRRRLAMVSGPAGEALEIFERIN
jgi:catechol 2,3-dioxygenase-like lactoylglutathione lyase family enzyme